MTTSGGETRRWFYVREGRRHGPVETARLVDLVLIGEVPEDCLVWHSGLPEWLPAREVEDIRRELPPPLPSSPAPPTPEPGTSDVAERTEPADEDADEEATDDGPVGGTGVDETGELKNGQRRRRKRKRHRDSKKRPPWLWPLIVVLVALMIFLWWLLRRMNEVPPGRIIQTGSARVGPSPGDALLYGQAASGSRWVATRGSARASPSARPA